MEDKIIKIKEKEFDKLTIKDNFIFGAVMRNEKQCKALLECILGIKIRKIEYTDVEKVIEKTYSSKGVRLDVYVEGELARSLDNEVQNVKNSEKWRREYMTLQMRDRENIELGEMKNQVFLIRKISRDKIESTSDFLGVSESFVIKVMDLIEENPDLDDEEIAEMLVDF